MTESRYISEPHEDLDAVVFKASDPKFGRGSIIIFPALGNYSGPVATALPPLFVGHRSEAKGNYKNTEKLFDSDGNPNVWLLLCLATHTGRISDRYLAIRAFAQLEARNGRHENDMDATIIATVESRFKEWFGQLLSKHLGEKQSEFFEMLAKMSAAAKRIDPKLAASQLDMLQAIKSEAEKTGEPPTKKAVRENWIACCSGRGEDSAKETMRALGFDWLPAAKRGKNAH